jgi:D-arabinose 1-dehydrogenase-like Zn-dependent alcohol dehydrogenase
MKAYRVTRPQRTWRLTNVPTPSPGPMEVLVRVRASGICGADLEISRGEYPLARFPLIPGHEVAGIVAEVGSKVSGFTRGEHVGVGWLQGSCGNCTFCISGDENLCGAQRATGVNVDGGHAEFLLTHQDYLHRLPENMEFEHAAVMMCPGMTAFSALKLAKLRPGGKVGILGLGGVGSLAVQFASAMGAEIAVMTRGNKEKIQLARQLGAHHVLASDKKNPGELLQKLGGVEVILSTTVSARDVSESIVGLKPNGVMVWIGVPHEPIPVHADPMCAGRRRIIGLPSGGRIDVLEALSFASRAGIKPMVETYPLSEAPRAIERMQNGLLRFRAILVPEP